MQNSKDQIIKHSHGWGVIFDLDGTMVDNAKFHQQAWIELGKRRNLDITEEYYQKNIHARSNEQIVKTLYNTDTVDKELVRQIENEKEGIYRDNYRDVVKPIAGLIELLQELSTHGVPCAVASNSPKENVDMVLEVLNIREYFKIVIDCNQVARGKPDPEVLFTIAQRFGLSCEKCIIFEDSSSGFTAAENASMPYIIITAGLGEKGLKFPETAAAVHKDFTTISIANLQAILK